MHESSVMLKHKYICTIMKSLENFKVPECQGFILSKLCDVYSCHVRCYTVENASVRRIFCTSVSKNARQTSNRDIHYIKKLQSRRFRLSSINKLKFLKISYL